MRKAILFVVVVCAAMVCFTTSCNNKKVEPADSTKTDSTTVADTTEAEDSATEIIAETPMPKVADQLFDDFFFNFIANKKLQRNRIKFPLPVETNGEVTKQIAHDQWKMERFFRPQGYYTLIFDNEKQADLAKSTKLDTVIVEKINLKQGLVEQYCFDHQDGRWEMNKIKNIGFSQNHNASFLKFLQKFLANDGRGSIKEPLSYYGPDPNGEETSKVNTTIPASEWSTFLPEVPGNIIYNILYGQKYDKSKKKILVFRGLSNGVETQLEFRQRGNDWRLERVVAY